MDRKLKNNVNRSTLILIIAIVVVVVMAEVSVFWWLVSENQSLKTELDSVKNQLNQTNSDYEKLKSDFNDLQMQVEKTEYLKTTEEEIFTNETNQWKTYYNEDFNYQINYPPGSTLIDHFGCITINYQNVYIAITGLNEKGEGPACGRTGIGVVDELKSIDETLIVNDNQIKAQGGRAITYDVETLDKNSETFHFVLGDNIQIQYGSLGDENDTYSDYLKSKPKLYEILKTFKFNK